MKTKKKNAFTLIELLVVIAVIAVLMGILMPALSKARSQAKRTICGSNLKQVGVATHMYADAWDGKMVPYTSIDGSAVSSRTEMMPWRSVVVYSPNHKDNRGDDYAPMHLAVLYEEDMIKDPKVFYCPAQPRQTTSGYPLAYNYDYYIQEGPWGTYIPSAVGGAHQFVRTSYNYWTHGQGKLDRLAQQPIVVDNLQEWEVIPHKSNNRPSGVSALFGDGHVNFCSGRDLFENDLWPRKPSFYDGPGDDRELFEALLEIIRKNYQ